MATPHSNDYSNWYSRSFHELTGSGLWLRGNEPNTLLPQEYDLRTFRVLIARLSTAFDVAESFSHRVLYRIAARIDECFPDMCYLPPPADTPIFQREGIPWLLGTGTKRGSGGFNLVAFSNSILQELINIPAMLEKSGIPLKKSERLADPAQPLILLGGSNALYTSLFHVEEPPVDGIFVGESAECIEELFRICAEGSAHKVSKSEILTRLEELPGFIQPDKPVETVRRPAKEPQLNGLLEEAPVSIFASEAGQGYLQISDGCPAFCSFCAESFGRKPYREVPAVRAIADARRLKAGLGLHVINIFSFNFNLHCGFGEIIENLVGIFSKVGMKSQRFDALALEPWMPAFLHAAGKGSFTCGLEGISARLRRRLHKSLSVDHLHQSLELLFHTPLRELKIFLIITGEETPEDFQDFKDLLKFMKECSMAASRRPRIIFSATPLVRFPWTPLEDEIAPLPQNLEPVVNKLKRILTRRGHEFRLAGSLEEYALSQVLARSGDPRVYQALQAAAREHEFVYYHFVPAGFWESFLSQAALLGLGTDMLFEVGSATDNRPWKSVSPGIGSEFLERQAQASRQAIDKGYCLGQPYGTGVCMGCGACDSASKTEITSPRDSNYHQPEALHAAQKARNLAAAEISFTVRLHNSCMGIPRPVIGAALASAIMKTAPELVERYRGYVSSFWSSGDKACNIAGHDHMTFIWDMASHDLLEGVFANEKSLSEINEKFDRWGVLRGIAHQVPDVWSLKVFSPIEFEPKGYFERHGMTFSLNKVSTGGHNLVLSKAALKKRLVKTAWAGRTPEGGWEINLTITSRFKVDVFVQEAFVCPEETSRARIRIEASIL